MIFSGSRRGDLRIADGRRIIVNQGPKQRRELSMVNGGVASKSFSTNTYVLYS